ncbi:MAG: ATP-binding protein [Butyrivibrio sp.]|nr:ATP-binding protein [Butyrivibrio sp.]
MISSVVSGAVHGISSYLMQIEVDVSDGLPGFSMVGFLSSEVKETIDRVKVAIRNNGIKLPSSKFTINLSPADIKKEGVIVDLPVAVGILVAMGEINEESLEGTVILGELGLDGDVKHINGTLPIVIKAKECGFKTVILPKANAREGAVIDGISIIGVETLGEVIAYLNAEAQEKSLLIAPTFLFSKTQSFPRYHSQFSLELAHEKTVTLLLLYQKTDFFSECSYLSTKRICA